MERDYYYYQYIVTIIAEEENYKEEERMGVISATDMGAAMSDLYEYFGNELIEVKNIKELMEGPVFDFTEAEDETYADFSIVRKVKHQL